ncbi:MULTISPECIES: hypothetical protein [Nocardiopsis]|uniref:ARB-07466-like C-terminal domain-containing protein n=2 Tax=Nocardiopsis alba TaxID=53437 RepID=J7L0A6_NOCAA|nr:MULTISPECIES: hypothetical protein [Nocardiopsis]AFR07053.1 hypothetical protein B005_4013 [Nocardiopsis alba ATCC BAA-2165]MEC3891979.1 hypothetical protein [Nocardiopsis sp. LDBS1602]
MTHRAAVPPEDLRRRRAIMSAAFLLVLAVIAVLAFQWWRENEGRTSFSRPWGPSCSVWVDGERVPLDRDQARRASTAAAVIAQGDAAPIEAPDIEDIPDEVMTALVEGPKDDAGPSMTCRYPGEEVEFEEEEPSGLTPRATTLKEGIEEVFADSSIGGYVAGGYDSGHGEKSAHYEGRALDIFYRPVNEENRREGWLLAHWLIAHAPNYQIDVIIFDDKIWSTRYPSMGWRHYDADPDNEILRHLDHVHADVLRGPDPEEG